MKFRVDVDGNPFQLDLQKTGDQITYKLAADKELGGTASVEQVMPGVFSVLINHRSFQVTVAPHPGGLEVWVGLQRHVISLADARDREVNSRKAAHKGPVEVCAQMPGKIIKLLAEVGAEVTLGQGLLVAEAMKMQNEVKAPKDGTLTRIYVTEGATVSAGDPLLVVE